MHAKITFVFAAMIAGAFALERSAMASDATPDNSITVNTCDFAIASALRRDHVSCELHHDYEDDCFDQLSSRKQQLDEGVGAFCKVALEEVRCEEPLILYHEHRGAEHVGSDGMAHDHLTRIDLDVVCVLEPKCEGLEEGAECWQEIANKSGCYVWNNNFHPERTTAWSGHCSFGGTAHGWGTASRNDGQVAESPYGNGKRYGNWIIRYSDGQVEEGFYMNGRRNDYWIIRKADGKVEEGPYVNGMRNGHWTLRSPAGLCGKQEYSRDEAVGDPVLIDC